MLELFHTPLTRVVGTVIVAVVFAGVFMFLKRRFKARPKPADPRIDPSAPAAPLPHPGEDVNEFMLRCVRDSFMVYNYADRNARINQCSAIWRLKKGK